ncbi:MAG TPA: PfkB family carbohydrate kinase, partial [Candidatus Saccharimonadia bacterium]
YYFPSKQEFQQLWEVNSIDEGLHRMKGLTSALTIVKDSDNGALAMKGDEVLRIPAFPVNPIHTVGAGDSFNAGFMVAQALGRDLEKSMRFGCAAAGLTISQPTMPAIEAVETLAASA